MSQQRFGDLCRAMRFIGRLECSIINLNMNPTRKRNNVVRTWPCSKLAITAPKISVVDMRTLRLTSTENVSNMSTTFVALKSAGMAAAKEARTLQQALRTCQLSFWMQLSYKGSNFSIKNSWLTTLLSSPSARTISWKGGKCNI